MYKKAATRFEQRSYQFPMTSSPLRREVDRKAEHLHTTPFPVEKYKFLHPEEEMKENQLWTKELLMFSYNLATFLGGLGEHGWVELWGKEV